MWRKGAEQYIELAMAWNPAIGLFSRQLTKAGIVALVEESVEGGKLIAGAANSLVDIGSGGGIPAVPLKLAFPELTMVLCEPKGRKATFLEEAIRVLRLERIQVFPGRIQDLASEQPFDAASMRGLKIREMAGPAARHVKPGGFLLAYYTDDEPETLKGGWYRREERVLGRGVAKAGLYRLPVEPDVL